MQGKGQSTFDHLRFIYLGEIFEKKPKNMQNKVASVESRLYIAVVPLLGTVYRQINIKSQVDWL